jgi:hypothetical protein
MDEVQIKFFDRANLFKAQVKLREKGITFRPYGVTLFIRESQEVEAMKVIKENEIVVLGEIQCL